MQHSSSYRPDIDGLRAIAVISVVAYHIGLPHIPGGFVGVDVFFVISGYLIISQIISAMSKGTFSFADFWSRRALRILPPYLLVIVASAIIAPFVLVLPSEYADFGWQVLWSSGMVVNHYFLSQHGYFNAAAETKPLLHLWSLAVEEQFYIVAPLIIAALAFIGFRFQRRSFVKPAITAIVIALFAVSLAGCVWLTQGGNEKNYAFFLMPLRMWEFIAGGVIGYLVPQLTRFPKRALSLLTPAGLALIGYAIATTRQADFPSFWAAIPVIGSTLVILGGSAHPQGIFSRALAMRPMVWIGLVSYAWYLWHWPLLTFGRIYNFGESSLSLDLAMGLLSLFLAIHTRLWIERPILAWRIRRTIAARTWAPALFGILACAHVAITGFFYAKPASDHIALRLPKSMLPTEDMRVRPKACDLTKANAVDGCLEQADGRRLGIVIGDSHARAIYPTIAMTGRDHGYEMMWAIHHGCPPMKDMKVYVRRSKTRQTEHESCTRATINAVQNLLDQRIAPDFAVINARWVQVTPWDGPKPASDGVRKLLGDIGADHPARDQQAAFTDGVRNMVDLLQDIGVKRILVIGPVPEIYRRAPECIVRADKYGLLRDNACSAPWKKVAKRARFATQWLDDAIQPSATVRYINPQQAFCDETWCRVADGDDLLYFDHNHLSAAGAAHLVSGFKDDFEWLWGAEPGVAALQ